MRQVNIGLCMLLLIASSNSAYAQLNAEVSVDISESDGLFTYEYTVTNAFLSALPLNYFVLDVANGGDVVIGDDAGFGTRLLPAPANWIGEYTPYELIYDDDFLPTGIRTNSVTGDPEFNRTEEITFLSGDGLTLDDDSGDIFPGDSLTFVIQSPYGPEPRKYEIAKLSPAFEFLGSTTDEIDAPSFPPVHTGLDCDFDGDGTCDLVDIDLLGTEIAAGNNAAGFDLTMDSLVNIDDLDAFLAHESVKKVNGDADFDGEVTFIDFLTLANNFNNVGAAWSDGDFVPNGMVEFNDFLVVANNFGNSFESSNGQAASVPEPSSLILVILSLGGLATRRRRLN